MKNRRKIITLIATLTCGFLIAGLTPLRASADKVENSVENKVYYGDMVTLDTINQYTERDVTLKNLNLEDPFVEFLIMPSERGTAETYTPDFEKMTLRAFNPTDKDKSLTISVFQHYLNTGSTEMSEKNIAINAAGGENQSLAAEMRGSRPADKDKLATGFGGNIAQSFDGCVHANSYMDEDGNPLYNGSECKAIRLYYDATENALYTDVGRDDENPTANTRITMSNGKYRWRIRDFDYDGYQDNPTNDWAGFQEGDELKFTIEFDNVKDGKTPTILISKLMGETVLKNQIVVETPSDGEVDIAYPIPEPIFYNADEYKEETFVSKGGSYKIEIYDKSAPGGKRLVNGQYETWTVNSSFTPEEAGKYCITYRANGYDKVKEIDVKVEEADMLEKVTIQPNVFADSCYVYEEFDIGASCFYPSQNYKPTVSLQIKRNGDAFGEAFVVDEHFNYKFDASGKYELVYTCVDYLNRTTVVTHNIDVQRYSLGWKGQVKENMALSLGTEMDLPSVTDVEVFDLVFNEIVEVQTCNITLSYNGGEYKPLSLQSFNATGEYTIKYAIEYNASGLESFEVERKIFIYDEFFGTITVNGLPMGTKLIEETDNAVEIYLKALKGVEIVIPYNYFNRTLNEVTFIDPNGIAQEITDKIAVGDYSFTPQDVGVYEVFALVENGLYRAVKVLYIDVRAKWVEFSDVQDLQLPIGSDIKLYSPICTDYYGNPVEFTTEVYFMGEKVDGTLLNKYGTYEIVYSYNLNGEIVGTSYQVNTFDSGNPIIKISEPKTIAYQNSMVAIAEYEVLDDSGLPPQVVITVKHNGKIVNVVNNSFKVTEQGEYMVSYTVTDVHGNITVANYTVTVKGYVGIIIPASIALVALGITLFVIFKKKS